MKHLLAFTSAIEAATGFVLLLTPAIAVRLLFGADAEGIAAVASRFAGVTLVALSAACWPGRDADRRDTHALIGMLSYNAIATAYLAYVAVAARFVGPLLWPAIALHALLSILLARSMRSGRAVSA